jgi:HD-GYP domain-containing protein (c-di-GMP phosphodiesterase class II)
MSATPDADEVLAAEVVAALSIATDFGMGFPLEHSLGSTIIAMRLADRLGVDAVTARQAYYGSLLAYLGCTADAEIAAGLFEAGALRQHYAPVMFGTPRQTMSGVLRALGGSRGPAPVRTIRGLARLPAAARGHRHHQAALCEVGQLLTDRLGLPDPVTDMFAYFTERWDGKGGPAGVSGTGLPLALRIVHVAADPAVQRLLGGREQAARVIAERAGHAIDPEIAGALSDHADDVLAVDDPVPAWDAVLALEPRPQVWLRGDDIDRALVAVAAFTDLLSPYFVGHSTGVAELAAAAAQRCRLDRADVTAIRRAGYVHDVGRVAIAAHVWQKPASLTADEREQVRLHAYYTERILTRSPFLAAVAPVAVSHHERLDGSGYHRSLTAPAQPMAARILAAADSYQAMTAGPSLPAAPVTSGGGAGAAG